ARSSTPRRDSATTISTAPRAPPTFAFSSPSSTSATSLSNVRLLIDTLRQVVRVPPVAVRRGPNGTFVYVLQPDNTVSVRLVEVTQQDETQAVIANGLQANDIVVTSGFAQLVDGRKVAVSGAARAPGPAPIAGNPNDTGGRPPRRQEGKASEATGATPGSVL